MKSIGIVAALLLIASCFLTWVEIDERNIVISGVSSEGTSFGKPGYMHIFLAVVYIILFVVQKVITRRINVFVSAFNVAWAVRNFIIISTCYAGTCPQKKAGIYLIVLASILMLLAVLIAPDQKKKRNFTV